MFTLHWKYISYFPSNRWWFNKSKHVFKNMRFSYRDKLVVTEVGFEPTHPTKYDPWTAVDQTTTTPMTTTNSTTDASTTDAGTAACLASRKCCRWTSKPSARHIQMWTVGMLQIDAVRFFNWRFPIFLSNIIFCPILCCVGDLSAYM